MIGCLQVAQWLAGRAAGLTSAESLRLEDHLGECSACRGELRALEALREELDANVEPLPVARRAWIVEQALATAAATAGTARPAPARRGRSGLPLAGGLVAAAAVGLYLARPTATPEASGAAHETARAKAAASALPAPAPGQEQTIEARAEPRPVMVGRARMVLGAHSRMRVGRDGSVTLDRGRLEVELAQADTQNAHGAQAARAVPFELRTERYGVTVLAARFVAEPESVQVLSGEVRVVAPDGAPLAEQVSAGAHWSVRDGAPAANAIDRDRARERARQGQTARSAGHAASVDAQLAQARAWLAERHVPEARAAIEGVLRSGPTRGARAEALSLAAECSLVEQHYEQAVAAYLQVAAQHPRLGAGQNALFAAARIRAQQGQATEARALLHSYLDRYPAGRFRDEAVRRLAQLAAASAVHKPDTRAAP